MKVTVVFFLLVVCATANCQNEAERKITYPYNSLFLLRNCSHDMRTFTFGQPSSFFAWWVFGKTNLESNKVVHFSSDYKMDSAYLRSGIERIRKSLPKNFFGNGLGEESYENEPNQDSIWFIKIFGQIEKAKNIKIFSAYKVVFTGNDARIDSQRSNPKVKDVIFITDKKELLELEKKLKNSPKTTS